MPQGRSSGTPTAATTSSSQWRCRAPPRRCCLEARCGVGVVGWVGWAGGWFGVGAGSDGPIPPSPPLTHTPRPTPPLLTPPLPMQEHNARASLVPGFVKATSMLALPHFPPPT